MLYIMKFKILFQKSFYSTLKRCYIYYFFKLKYLNQKGFFNSTFKKHNFFLCEHRVYILKGFKFYINKIKYFSNIYIVIFEKD